MAQSFAGWDCCLFCRNFGNKRLKIEGDIDVRAWVVRWGSFPPFWFDGLAPFKFDLTLMLRMNWWCSPLEGVIAEVSSTTVDSKDSLLAEIWLVKVVFLAMYIRLITYKNLPFSYVLLDTYLPYSTEGYLELQFFRLANQSQNCNSTELQTMELQSCNSFPAKFLPIPINLSLPLGHCRHLCRLWPLPPPPALFSAPPLPPPFRRSLSWLSPS